MKEFWKKCSYWQKGAIIGIIFGLLERIYFYSKNLPKEFTIGFLFTFLFILFLYCLFFGFIGLSVDLFLKIKSINIKEWKKAFREVYPLLFFWILILLFLLLIIFAEHKFQ